MLYVFLGKIFIYVVDADAAATNPDLPKKLADSCNLAKFVGNVLPGVLETMKRKHGWADIPRTLVHDKASYMVTPAYNRLNLTFSAGVQEGGFRSWIGDESDSAAWLAKKFGDLYLHETAIAHVRRLLDGKFAHNRVHETAAHFKCRMEQIADHMNSPDFAACGGTGLAGLAKQLRPRCEALIKAKGERLPK